MLRPLRWMLCRLNAAIRQAESEAYQVRKVTDDHIRKLARIEASRLIHDRRRHERAKAARHD
ncbi:hypothetical protein [Loktanella atrilutea]|uniref:hypothetical protein n=1 Tax=Loktanella atrilutea TaxID=366533 RepID=UPI0011607798|nr:hypothetical protein [Loktanella atrilutea]